jgi:hypothetical protein
MQPMRSHVMEDVCLHKVYMSVGATRLEASSVQASTSGQ